MKKNGQMENEQKTSIRTITSISNIASGELIDFDKNPGRKQKMMDKIRIRKFDTHHNLVDYKIRDDIEKFKPLGEGLYFYFYFIKFFLKIFGLIVILSLVVIVLNSTGNGLKFLGEINFFLATSLGNTIKIYFNQEDQEQLETLHDDELDDFLDEKYEEINRIFYVQIVIEMLISITFFVSIYVFQHQVNKQIKEMSKKNLSARQYTLMIKGLPEKKLNKDVVKAFFSQFGNVQDVAFAYRYNNCLYHLVNIVQSKKKLKILKAKT